LKAFKMIRAPPPKPTVLNYIKLYSRKPLSKLETKLSDVLIAGTALAALPDFEYCDKTVILSNRNA